MTDADTRRAGDEVQEIRTQLKFRGESLVRAERTIAELEQDLADTRAALAAMTERWRYAHDAWGDAAAGHVAQMDITAKLRDAVSELVHLAKAKGATADEIDAAIGNKVGPGSDLESYQAADRIKATEADRDRLAEEARRLREMLAEARAWWTEHQGYMPVKPRWADGVAEHDARGRGGSGA